MIRVLVVLLALSCGPAPRATSLGGDSYLSAVVAITDREGDPFCSGVIVREGILTAAHCVRDPSSVFVGTSPTLGDDWTWTSVREVMAIRVSRERDLALLGWHPPLPRLDLALRTPPRGAPIVCVGHPAGVPYVSQHGRVSRGAQAWRGHPSHWFLVDSGLVPGMSGGGCLDEDMALIGIVSFYIYSHSVGGVVSAESIRDFLNE